MIFYSVFNGSWMFRIRELILWGFVAVWRDGPKSLSAGDSAATLGMLPRVALQVSLWIFGQRGFVLFLCVCVLWLELYFSIGHRLTSFSLTVWAWDNLLLEEFSNHAHCGHLFGCSAIDGYSSFGSAVALICACLVFLFHLHRGHQRCALNFLGSRILSEWRHGSRWRTRADWGGWEVSVRLRRQAVSPVPPALAFSRQRVVTISESSSWAGADIVPPCAMEHRHCTQHTGSG